MNIRKNILTIYIGNVDPQVWLQETGKPILMPVLLETARDIIQNNLEEKQAARVETDLRGKKEALDFWVMYDGVDDTLDKVLQWALEEEKYEMGQEVKDLKEKLQENEDFSYRR